MLRLLAAGTIAFLLTPPSFGQNETAQRQVKSLEKLTAAVISAESYDVWEAYRELFTAAGKDHIPALQCHNDGSIAVQAAWQKVIGTLTEKEREEGLPPRDKQALSRFVGFVEGRTRVAVPKWWADFIVKGPVKAKQKWYHNAGRKYVFAPKDTRITSDGDGYTLHISNDSVKLPDSILRKADSGELVCRVSGLFTQKHCFVAVHDGVGFSHDVACVDRTTGKLVWVSKACGCWIGGASGVHESWVTVTHQHGQVVIFGASWTGFYMHSFDPVTGKSRFKFSTVFAAS